MRVLITQDLQCSIFCEGTCISVKTLHDFYFAWLILECKVKLSLYWNGIWNCHFLFYYKHWYTLGHPLQVVMWCFKPAWTWLSLLKSFMDCIDFDLSRSIKLKCVIVLWRFIYKVGFFLALGFCGIRNTEPTRLASSGEFPGYPSSISQ